MLISGENTYSGCTKDAARGKYSHFLMKRFSCLYIEFKILLSEIKFNKLAIS